MALVLKLRKGHGFFVDSHPVEVTEVENPYKFTVQAKGYPSKKVEMDAWTEVMPGVEVQAGVPQNQEGKIVSVQIRAPGQKIVRYGSRAPGGSCPVCHGTKIMQVRTPCPSCKGFGCEKCSQGYVKVGSKCPECN